MEYVEKKCKKLDNDLTRYKLLFDREGRFWLKIVKIRCTGCPDQIVRSVNLILLPNQKTCRKCKDRLEIVMKRATKHEKKLI